MRLPETPDVVGAIHNYVDVEVGPHEDSGRPAVQIRHRRSADAEAVSLWGMDHPDTLRALADALRDAADWLETQPKDGPVITRAERLYLERLQRPGG